MRPIYALFLLALGVNGQRYKSSFVNTARRDDPAPMQGEPPKTCPGELTQGFEFPHLIIPIDSTAPDKALGTSYNGTATPTISSIFNFDIPSSSKGMSCSLWFLFPQRNFLFKGDGAVKFSRLAKAATTNTSFANAPALKDQLLERKLSPGGNSNVTNFECPAAEKIAFRMDSVGSTELSYFQDSSSPP
ncbi:hypothetical protein PABG_11168 [Paracoccidioides brasiliensis Pb03]|uniref:Ubiquitin 3 binding protein But2 C-terminal domain-containing protein n=1 Tax=Paracoccidioides brasiliensis (strain Pb18) TaxID=502780 RepID=C1G7I2_PARBD|nr:uncharacterized protein PADG_03137 [Paracoccidioides brasiliensis Pb18]EEH47039.1 hypothetical protein PADG_03137 [Paracoccidioides brasiliensis Pb18]KGY15920.1 hypothetical protein PABG_11168 [Paracoccidioides brasiliensis Pb03]ODH51473.1 hypothetical protein GX48_02339 [Paracoccidioides brasiliensis]